MKMTDDLYKNAFEKNLTEHGLNQTNNTDNICNLVCGNKPNQITAQFITSEPIDESIHGSHNGNKIQAIGYFRFTLPPPGVSKPYFFIFGFHNPQKDCIEFLIIPANELNRRLQSKDRTKNEENEIELQFWLMEDNFVFETKGISGEGEWWFINGRMGEQSILDYSKFLNYFEGMRMS